VAAWPPSTSNAARVDSTLREIRAAGMDTALAVIAVLYRNLGAALVATNGVTAARAILEATIIDANAADDD
jgi:hypothetical protein